MVLDIIIIGILLLSAFLGYKKGLVGIILSIATLIVSIILAVILQSSVTNYLYNETTIGKTIEEGIKESIQTEIDNIEKITADSEDNEEENKISNYLDMFFEENEIASVAIDETAYKITMFALKGISFVVIFILVYIICYIIRMILNFVFDLPILNSVNKAGGIILNILKTIFKLWIVLAIISFVAFIPTFADVIDMINDSFITKFLYENNIIVNILKSTLKL